MPVSWMVHGNTVDILDNENDIVVTYTICTEKTKNQYIDSYDDEENTDAKKLSKPVIRSVTSQPNGVKLSWKTVKNATGYKIVYSTNSKYKKAKRKKHLPKRAAALKN